MRDLLRKPDGALLVLHSTATMKAKQELSKYKRKEFTTAYKYLRDWRQHLDY